MPKPLDQTPPEDPFVRFTGRDRERNVFRRVLDLPPGATLPVVMFYGVGGTGKSWLLRKLREELKEKHPFLPCAALDFEPRSGGTAFHTDSSKALAHLRGQFEDVPCPRFDLAYSWLRFKQDDKDEPALKVEGFLGAAFECVKAAADAAEVPGGVMTVVGKVAKKFLRHSSLADWFARKVGEEDYLKLRGTDPQLIYPQLAERLLLDLTTNLPPRDGHACRGVLVLDTFEALGVGQASGQQHEREGWVRDLHRPDSPLLVVVAGRDKLRWAERAPSYSKSEVLEQHLVGGLSRQDATAYLAGASVTDEPLQNAILQSSAALDPNGSEPGHHAQSLGLFVDIVANCARTGRPIDGSMFERKELSSLAHYFLKSLPDATALWVRRLARTPGFDKRAALSAYSRVPSLDRDAAWKQLQTYSFMHFIPATGWYAIHATVRDAVADEATATDDHRYWRGYWGKRSDDGTMAIAWSHRYHLRPRSARQEWVMLSEHFAASGEMQAHRNLLDWWALTPLFDRPPSTREEAQAHCDVGSAWGHTTIGNRGENVHRALACYQVALGVFTRDIDPLRWAGAQNDIGLLLDLLPTGNRAENLRAAVGCFHAALGVYTEDTRPDHWSTVQLNLGNAYLGTPDVGGAAIGQAIQHFKAGLRACDKAKSPTDWAKFQLALGNAYVQLPTGNRADNLTRGIEHYRASCQVFTEEGSRREWALAQNNLASAFRQLPSGDPRDNFEQAVACCEAALRVVHEDTFPSDWAMTQHQLGGVYHAATVGDPVANNLRAAEHISAAFRVFTEAAFPEYWAENQVSLAAVRTVLPDEHGGPAAALACCEAAMRVWTEQGNPDGWARAQITRGNALKKLDTGERPENLRRAVECYDLALRVYSEEQAVFMWATATSNRAEALGELAGLTNDPAHLSAARAGLEAAARCFEGVGETGKAQGTRDILGRLPKGATESD